MNLLSELETQWLHLMARNGTEQERGLWPVSGVDWTLPSTLYRQKLTPS